MIPVTQRLIELRSVSESLAAAIPSRIKEDIDNYVWWGRPTGSFVRAVLENRLMEAIGRADERSMASLKDISCYVYNAVPSGCQGSPEAVKEHLARGRELQESFGTS
jgi:hypothetical protein